MPNDEAGSELPVTRDIIETLAQFDKPFLVILAVAVFDKLVITTMIHGSLACMLYRAPVLFASGGDFLHIRNQTVKVTAIKAIQLFYQI